MAMMMRVVFLTRSSPKNESCDGRPTLPLSSLSFHSCAPRHRAILLRNLLLGIDKELRTQFVNPLTEALVDQMMPNYAELLITAQGLERRGKEIGESLNRFVAVEGEER